MSGNQYRATKIWHEIIESFQANVPLKRHWRNFRTYSDCFGANEAIEWLYRYLKTSHNFKSQTSITRQQAIQLLQIFLKERIIEDVRGDKYNNKEFQDDDRLFKFCSSEKYSIQYRNKRDEQSHKITEPTQQQQKSEIDHLQPRRQSLITTTTKVLREKNLNQDLLPPPPPTPTKLLSIKKLVSSEPVTKHEKSKPLEPLKRHQELEISEIWSQLAIKYLHDALKIDLNTQTNSLLENIQLAASNIEYNCTHVNKHGVVTNSNNKFEDLPAWVMQAMTTLVHWTDFKKDQDENESKKTNRPSFRDVYNEVNIYFHDNKEPLLTKQFSKLFIRIFRYFLQNTKQFDIDDFMKNLKEHLNSQARHNDLNYIDNEAAGIDMAGINQNEVLNCCGGDNMCCSQCQSTLDFVNNWLNCNEIEFNEFVMNLNSNNYQQAKKFKSDMTATTNYDDSSTIVKEDERKKLKRNNSFIAAVSAMSDNSSTSGGSGCNTSSSINDESKVVNNNSKNISIFKTHSLNQISEAVVIKDNLSHQKSSSNAFYKRTTSFNDSSQKIQNMLINSISLNNIAQMQMPSKLSVGALSSLISSVSLKDVQTANDSLTLGFDYETFKNIIRAFRISSSFLPPINKRKLHLLLRLLYKLKFSDHAKLLILNEYDDMDFEMDYDIESTLINSFLKSIILFDESDENLAIKIVHVLINNYSEIMRVPEDFVSTVNESINVKKSNFCSKISIEEYEEEKNESKEHLIKLLYSILTNVSMTQEDKIKRLKQFKEFYPEIYEEKHATIKKAINVLGINETSRVSRYQVTKFLFKNKL